MKILLIKKKRAGKATCTQIIALGDMQSKLGKVLVVVNNEQASLADFAIFPLTVVTIHNTHNTGK